MIRERAVACLKGLASGDAVGKQTETLSRENVRRWYPAGIRGFEGPPGDVIPRYRGNSRREWRIGETTDDTEQTLAVAGAVLRGRGVRHPEIGAGLLQCRKSVQTESMSAFLRAGDPARIATVGDGCGAAMRVAPVGLLCSPARFEDLLRGAREASIPTHGGAAAIAAAAAVAAAVSSAVEGWTAERVLEMAVRAAREAAPECPMAPWIENTQAILSRRPPAVANDIPDRLFPDRTETKVPLAIALALTTCSAERTIGIAANVGGDSDSVASIGGAIAGALRPDTVNEGWVDVVERINRHGLAAVAEALVDLRL